MSIFMSALVSIAEVEPARMKNGNKYHLSLFSPSTESKDRGVKFDDYAAHGVREYWIIDADKEIVEQYLLGDGDYGDALKVHEGTIRSAVIDGFEIPVRAIFDDDANREALKGMMG